MLILQSLYNFISTLVGGSWIYGPVDENGEFTGNDIAYLYQDLELAIIGKFKHGLLVCKITHWAGACADPTVIS